MNSQHQEPLKFRFKCTFSGTISDAMRRRGWTLTTDSNWDIFWCDMNQSRELFLTYARALQDHQRVGHFRNVQEISRKNMLVRNLQKFKYKLQRSYGKAEANKMNFLPLTYILPAEHHAFVAEQFNPTSKESNLWIIKPAAGAQGRGIFIFKKFEEYTEWRKNFEPPGAEADPHSQTVPNPYGASRADVDVSQQDTTDDIQETDDDREGPPKVTSDDTLDTDNQQPGDPTAEPGKKKSKQRRNGAQSDRSTSPDLDSLDNSDDDYQDSLTDDDDDVDDDDDDDDPTQARELKHEMRQDAYVVQKYIANPYLIGGRKFDIRFYVLVTSYNPLAVWVYREGFARFSAGQFSLDALQDVYIHLTNVAIQKTSEGYNAEKGSKWSLKSLREYLTARHGREKVQKMFNSIDVIVIRSLQSVCKSVIHDKHCFEVYGFDVLIDKQLVPWLLEVNACPSFTPSNEEDYILKCGLIDDTASILDLEGRLTGLEKRVGGYDLIWKDGPIYANPADCGYAKGVDGGPKLNTFLGCRNDRVQQLRELYKTAWFLKGANKTFRSGKSFSEAGDFNKEHFGGIEKNMGKDKRFRFPRRWSRWR